jgi:nicotinamidase-related amidase
MSDLNLTPARTALVLIDLQHSNLARALAPYSGADVTARAAALAQQLRARGATIVYVRVDVTSLLSLPADAPLARPAGAPPLPANAAELVPEAGAQPGDIFITKRQWGAFYDSGLDQQLRRRGIDTLILGGIATHIGVESTARQAYDMGYALVFAEDAMTSISDVCHRFPVENIFRNMGKVRTTAAILAQLAH